jgi:hypothetical protein
MAPIRPGNRDIADVLERVADLLEAQWANPFRVRAYRNGARAVRMATQPLTELLDEKGIEGLEALPGIGKSLASAIAEFAHSGRLGLLDRLEGQISPEDLFTTVPAIGEELARRIHAELGIETLEELELAAHDGRLDKVSGFGERRTHGVRDALAGILSRSTRRRARRVRLQEGVLRLDKQGTEPPDAEGERPSVKTILEIDTEYRRSAEAGDLMTIAPRRFNPEGTSWLPILHAEREGLSFTALYSNTARAHELGATRDWVVIYYERDGHEDQCTVVTERQGPLAGVRVVRGREGETARYYGQKSGYEKM